MIDTQLVELFAQAHYAGGKRTKDNHMLRWELKTKLYITPEVEENIFYPFHKYSTVISVQNPHVDDIEPTLFRHEEDSKSCTMKFDDGQLIVKGPGLVTFRWEGVTRNEAEVFLADDFAVAGGVPDDFRCSAEFSVNWPPARHEDSPLRVSDALAWNNDGAGKETVGYWNLG